MANLFRCGGGRSEASYQNLMDQLVEETATGPIASFTDGANNIPAKEIICHINPTETGTGEKSPQNPYVIGGHTEINVTNANKAIVNDIYAIEPIQAGTGNPSPTNKRHLSYGLSLVRDDDSVLNIWGGDLNIKTGELISRFEEYVYTGSKTWNYSSVYKSYYAAYPGLNMIKYGLDHSFIGYAECFVPFDGTTWPSKTGECCIGYINANTNGFRLGFYASEESDIDTLIQGTQVIYESETPTTIQLSATELERAKDALGITTYTVPFDQTVYGGELILQEGQNDTIQPTWGIYTITGNEQFSLTSTGQHVITSVNVSSLNIKPVANSNLSTAMCEFAETKTYNSLNVAGDTDGIGIGITYIIVGSLQYNNWSNLVGKKIVFELATAPDPITLPTKTQVNTLLGSNNIYHDCNGDIDVTYRANGALYVQEHPITRGLMAARPAEQIQEQEEQQEEKEINKSEDNER